MDGEYRALVFDATATTNEVRWRDNFPEWCYTRISPNASYFLHLPTGSRDGEGAHWLDSQCGGIFSVRSLRGAGTQYVAMGKGEGTLR